EKIIDLKPLENFEEAVLAVEAPFYSPVTKLFVLAEKKLGLTYNFNYPSVIFSQTTFNFGLQACNELDMVRKVFVEIELDEEFLNSDKKFSQLTIPQKSCERTTYLLTPKKSGKTSVLFNIVVENNKETKSNTIEIV
ncbi:MAG: hypothetical protein HYW50_03335, partial [Candidatus Diapherotrites archaeon]|nr:hypothetical protein [Candidatus Diapherotrites archaeon]